MLTISGCYTLASLGGFWGGPMSQVRVYCAPGYWGRTAGPSTEGGAPFSMVVHQTPQSHLRNDWSLNAEGLSSPKSEALLYFWQLGDLYCRFTSQARNLHQRAKKNTSKNKHESQDFMPGTPATHILLAGSLVSLLSVLILLKQAEACSNPLDLRSALRSCSSVLSLFHGVVKSFR